MKSSIKSASLTSVISAAAIIFVLRSCPYLSAIVFNSLIIRAFSLAVCAKVAAISAKSSVILRFSSKRCKICSLFNCLNLMLQIYSACSASTLNASIKFGTTASSFSVFFIILMALSISSRISAKACSRCSLTCNLRS